MSTKIYNGSCACGELHFKANGESEGAVVCYCLDCRKNSGHVGQIMGTYSTENVEIEDSGDNLGRYTFTNTASGKPKEKLFCKNCGCTILTLLEAYPGKTFVRTTLFDDPFDGYEPVTVLFEETKEKKMGKLLAKFN